ncbi:MAG: hypothetical protein L6Q76_04225 [Polyangiaceae bacterium]|nr:hypothetical protein [Polyangiaceae bacterium]
MRVRRSVYAVLLTLPMTALAAPAAAQVRGSSGATAAADLFKEAMSLLEKKRYDEACPKFLQSYELDRTKPGGLYAYAECLAEAGKIASAAARYEAYIRAVDELPADRQAVHADRKIRAKEQITALAPDMPELTIVLHSYALPGTRITHNGEVISAEQLEKPRVVDPGEHRVTIEVPGAPPVEERLTLNKGEKRRFVAKSPQPPAEEPKPTASPPTPTETSGKNKGFDFSTAGTYAGFGVGAMGLVVGAVTGAMFISKKNSVEDGVCSKVLNANGERECTEHGLIAVGSGHALGTVSTIAFGLGLVGAATGTIFMLTAGDDDASLGKQPFSVWRAGGHGALGIGGAGLVLGAITGVMTFDEVGTVNEGCSKRSNGDITVRECGHQAFMAGHGGRAFGAVSTAAFITGAVGLAAGAGLLLLEPSDPERTASRRWFAVGPTSLSLNGMEIGVQGRW